MTITKKPSPWQFRQGRRPPQVGLEQEVASGAGEGGILLLLGVPVLVHRVSNRRRGRGGRTMGGMTLGLMGMTDSSSPVGTVMVM